MASKPNWKNTEKDKNQKSNAKTHKNEFLDEISLRDEIFDLKRQILILKKSNERNLIKLRKYEDETKKKDRQIEQLMDPVKNGDIRKLLSAKGAALLLNLKEQNNTLIQMVLAKDIQIRKLASEIKTSKLYASGKRAECYRGEIDRLRNLLVKSQSTLKEAQDVQEKRSVCVGGTPDNKEMVFSSDQSSPRDLEELHFTIQTLEIHMKYSNELLAKKNEQILQLTDQLNSLQSCNCGKNVRARYFLEKCAKPSDRNVWEASGEKEPGGGGGGGGYDGRSYETESPSTAKCLSTTPGIHTDWRRLPNSAPPCPVGNFQNDPRALDPGPDYWRSTTNDPQNPSPPAAGTCFTETRQFPPRSEINNANDGENSVIASCDASNERVKNSGTEEEESDADTAEFEMMERKIEDDRIEIESPVKLAPRPSGNPVSGEPAEEEEILVVVEKEEDKEDKEDAMPGEEEGEYQFEETATQNGGDLNDVPDNPDVSDEGENENSESIMELYRYSFDSSLDSDTSAWNAVQVEAEINHDSEIEKYAKSDESGDGNKNARESNDGGDDNNNEDDDDDVIIG